MVERGERAPSPARGDIADRKSQTQAGRGPAAHHVARSRSAACGALMAHGRCSGRESHDINLRKPREKLGQWAVSFTTSAGASRIPRHPPSGRGRPRTSRVHGSRYRAGRRLGPVSNTARPIVTTTRRVDPVERGPRHRPRAPDGCVFHRFPPAGPRPIYPEASFHARNRRAADDLPPESDFLKRSCPRGAFLADLHGLQGLDAGAPDGRASRLHRYDAHSGRRSMSDTF